eukprot:CAMPEP_0167801690 /NCGR_PEP_ID=MMETSP0111_2-20121227/18617_1 /TAXON_ID=91324 /ORGANISM="Lotharella globosa, Strain CCCM811" /LENGTH=35 /DNA_ID= /DNA_START= /DNA_END= /DNA_ORIENTATION=
MKMLKPNASALFLFDSDQRVFHGVFEAASHAGDSL